MIVSGLPPKRLQRNSCDMPRTHEALTARPPYDSATAALLECIEPLGIFRTMTVQNILSWHVPADEVRADFQLRHPDIDLEDVESFVRTGRGFSLRSRGASRVPPPVDSALCSSRCTGEGW